MAKTWVEGWGLIAELLKPEPDVLENPIN